MWYDYPLQQAQFTYDVMFTHRACSDMIVQCLPKPLKQLFYLIDRKDVIDGLPWKKTFNW